MKKQLHYENTHRLALIRLRLVLVAVLAFLLPGFSNFKSPAPSSAQQPKPTQARALVCVLSRIDNDRPEGNMDAVVLIENGKLVQPYPEHDEASQRKFAEEYFSPDRKYRVTFGGGEAGIATVRGSKQRCNNVHATAVVKDGQEISLHVSALATDSDSLGRKPIARRRPTAEEHQAIQKLAHDIYLARGTPKAFWRAFVNSNLTATDLDGDGKFELIGTFLAVNGKARRDLFLIAEPAGTTVLPFPGKPTWPKFKPALVHFQAYTLSPKNYDSSVDFVDQLDLDGDGVGEVFVQNHGFEAYGYSIYKRTNGRWRRIYTTTGDAC